MESYKYKLKDSIKKFGNHLCIGIDPTIENLSPAFARYLSKYGPIDFLQTYVNVLLDVAVGKVAAIKPQSAYFEALGSKGMAVLEQLMHRAKTLGLITILDVKRGDISSTMRAYGTMAFDVMQADAMTITPYMGLDVTLPLVPWLKRGRGVYIVWRSSNPSGSAVQDVIAQQILHDFADFFTKCEIDDGFGLVFGATKIGDSLTQIPPRILKANLLMPGIGAQGGHISPVLRSMLKENPAILVPQSRSIGGLFEVALDQTPLGDLWDNYAQVLHRRVDQCIQGLEFTS